MRSVSHVGQWAATPQRESGLPLPAQVGRIADKSLFLDLQAKARTSCLHRCAGEAKAHVHTLRRPAVLTAPHACTWQLRRPNVPTEDSGAWRTKRQKPSES